MTRRPVAIAAALDTVAVLAFVIAGRRSHDETNDLAGILGVAAPFLIGLALGWLVLRAWRRPFELTTGLGLTLITVSVGMVLRNLAWDRGTATSFVIVATIVTGALLLGWRAVASRFRAGS